MKKIFFLMVAPSLFVATHAAVANAFFDETSVTGDIRFYNFSTDYTDADSPSISATSLGGGLNILTGPIFSEDFKLGVSVYTARPVGLNSSNEEHLFTSLPSDSITTLGQSYLQYQHEHLLIRAGNQLIDTPWLNAADTYMIPATYQGFYGTYTLWQDITFTALRTFRFKARTADHFTPTNLYNPENLGEHAMTAFGTTDDHGALAFGGQLKKNSWNGQLWYYQFYDLANLVYGDARYDFDNTHTVKPYVAGQALREWGSGDNILAPYAGGNAHANVFGLLTGITIQQATFSFAYNDIPKNNDTFQNGDILSPYTVGYHSDPLYTTSMLTGLIEASSGQAIKLKAEYHTENKAWTLSSSYAKYFVSPTMNNLNEMDFDGIYAFPGKLKGFTIQNRIGILNGSETHGRELSDRVMFQYSF